MFICRINVDRATGQNKSDLPAGLQPNHKQSIVMFLERVYGLETQETFFRLLEDGFLPDLRAATMLDRVYTTFILFSLLLHASHRVSVIKKAEKADSVESDMALALNRYIGNSVLPMLIQYYAYFTNAENYASLLDATLHTVYRCPRSRFSPRDSGRRSRDFLVALTSSKALRRRERGGAPSEEPQAPSQGQNASPERRFASSLLEKLLQYLDVAAINLKVLRPSVPFSRRTSFKTSSRDVKFFSKVVLPLMEKVFVAQRAFFLMSPTATSTVGTATIREKEMVASLFCKLGGLLRAKFSVFGNECKLTVSCLQTLIRATDAKAIVKNCPDFVKTSMLTYFNNAADDLATTLLNLQQGRYSHLRGTTMKTSSSLNYVQLVLLPVLTALFDHMAANEFGSDLLLSDIQVACYKILNSLYTLGTNMELTGEGWNFVKAELERHRPAYGNCLGAFAATFPVAFLEPSHNKHNPYCIHGKAQEHSLEAQAVMATLESSMPTLEDLMGQVEKFVTANGKYLEQPFIIEVMIPMLCRLVFRFYLLQVKFLMQVA
ncbi:hypothetical protein HPB48_013787 [Haemaphysalis longicornis]|uniref:Uncharacterized protein n=1 Tax=Haemaphysalis longicornis TaxID=44386 RepID=A0A9J6GXC9_HAELO|nr:hypothetical protein HPB48_013787 [Haemaphysalis longicornis]